MKKAFVVARWEYVEKIKSKTFLISLFLMPIVMIAVGVIPSLLATREDTESKVIGLIDQSGEVAESLAALIEERYTLPDGQPNYIIRAISAKWDLKQSKKSADSLVIAELIEGYIVIGKSVMTDSSVEYRSQNVGNIKITERLTRAVRDVVVEKRLKESGLDPSLIKRLTSSLEMKTIKLSKSGHEEEAGFERIFFTAYAFVMMMFFLIMTSGQMLVRSMLEEKSNRVVEVLMSSCSAQDLMAGKILGLSALGLTQMGFWLLIGLTISINFAVTLVPPLSALILFLYGILGYVLYSAIFVAAGAPVSTEQEAQQITSYLVMILVIPIVLAFMVIQNPNSLLVKVLTFIPLLTPSMMAMRIPIQMPPAHEIILSLLVLAASTVGAIWAAGKIFRTTILITGKRPSLGELFEILRAH